MYILNIVNIFLAWAYVHLCLCGCTANTLIYDTITIPNTENFDRDFLKYDHEKGHTLLVLQASNIAWTTAMLRISPW